VAKSKASEIKNDLLEQLKHKSATGNHYADLVEDYMRLWETKNELQSDIKTRGAKVEIVTASSVNLKTNDSILDLLKVNAQMLKILDSLGLRPTEQSGSNDNDM
jgi:hypothetical protein